MPPASSKNRSRTSVSCVGTTPRTSRWLVEAVGVPPEAASQIEAYLGATREVLGVVPTQETLVLERFFDEAGGMQLVLHAPFGGRINRAWGLALRKKFCRSFNFELQAAANEDAIVLSLGPQHSFPLDDVFGYLKPETARETLIQALLPAPMFQTRWRWNAAACFEHIHGDIEVPWEHPIVRQTVEVGKCCSQVIRLSSYSDFPLLQFGLKPNSTSSEIARLRKAGWATFHE